MEWTEIILPEPIVKCPTSLLPGSPQVIPTALPEVCMSRDG